MLRNNRLSGVTDKITGYSSEQSQNGEVRSSKSDRIPCSTAFVELREAMI